ncbi:glycosyl hydrolase [Desertivirga brevis]|uniref:glycosyl hydrolase n=1 Tax=Desertivirga brevis TaxID=2810310 RepID=UPI001A974787|nr:glycosyl hydrolase [Pedobacter sp. SYSU D00873]
MNRKYLKASLLGSMLAVTSFVSAQTSKPEWPKITQQNKPWTRWWWEGSAVNNQDLTWMLEEYSKAGLGGVEITPIYGVKGYEKQFLNFLSPEWTNALKHTLEEGKRLDLGVDMAQASGWPFGGPWVGNEDASKYIAFKNYILKGGEKLKEAVLYNQPALVRTVGERIDISKLKEPIASNPNLQLHAFDQVRFPKALPLQALMAYSDKGQTVDLTSKVDANGILNWTAPAGEWTLYAAFMGWHGKMVERAGPGGEGYAIDHFSRQATSNFLKYFDEQFKGHDLSSLRAFFNDSYEVDDAQGEANWTPKFFEEFRKRRGYDLKNYLPALFAKDVQDKNQRVLTDYRETISDLLLENYTETWHQWASSRKALIRNQAHGSPANILDLYAATDIPEIEGTDILRIKFASSAAHVTGKPLASSESATWENEHFLSKLGDIKKAMDLFLLGGVNHTFYHGANYTPKNDPWPGWLFYAAVHFTPNNPFWKDFGKLNNYVARAQSFLQLGKPSNDVLLYLPIYDSFATPGRSLLQHYDGLEKGFKGNSVEENAKNLEEKGYSFDFISDRQIYNLATLDSLIKTADITYKTIVVPQTRFMPLATYQKLVDLARSGSKVIFFKSTPDDVPGLGNFLEQRRADFKHVTKQLAFSGTGVSGLKKASVGKGTVYVTDDLDKALKAASVQPESMVHQGLQFIRRKNNGAYYYFILNSGNKEINEWVPVGTSAASVAMFNPMTEKSGYAAIRRSSGNTTEVYLQLAKGESCILETSESPVNGAPYTYREVQGTAIPINGEWTVNFITGGPTIPKESKTKTLASWTTFTSEGVKDFSGTAKYSTHFKRPTTPSSNLLLDLGKVEESARVVVNGQELATLLGPAYQVEIPANLMKKKNKLEIFITNSMANRVIYLDRNKVNWKKFYNTNMPPRRRENAGKDGLFTAANWEPLQSGLIGPVTITPLTTINPK